MLTESKRSSTKSMRQKHSNGIGFVNSSVPKNNYFFFFFSVF